MYVGNSLHSQYIYTFRTYKSKLFDNLMLERENRTNCILNAL